ncbi:Retrovirus-related Pol polyprotein from transposon RE1 [Cardamine amara subsp. amara]|uniref:Retrovirus-related Pol polyprotein from transposon RE1 n=1 Tax=Cardamine amara subsp. amara TaxID=228776 RepID=A0ABD1B4E8_CARAN
MCSTQALVKAGINLGDPDAKEYRAVVGSLQYLSFTRPDIDFTVNRLSQFIHCPTTAHWEAVKRVLRYLAGTVTHGITLRANSSLTLTTYSDADWGGDRDDLCSTNAYVVYPGNSSISWASRKQKGVARASTEAEYRAVAVVDLEVKWICSLITELGIKLLSVPIVHCDNIGATYLCANPVFHSRMKHIAIGIDYHFVQELVQQGYLHVSHITTIDQLADALTKPLSCARFLNLAVKIGVSLGTPS